jgi:hypothetical protein
LKKRIRKKRMNDGNGKRRTRNEREKEWRIRIEDFMGQMADRDIRRENRERKMIEIMERMEYRMGKLFGLMKELVGDGEQKEVGGTDKETGGKKDGKEDEDEQDKGTDNGKEDGDDEMGGDGEDKGADGSGTTDVTMG